MTPPEYDRLTFDDVVLFLDVLGTAAVDVDLEVQIGKGRLAVQRSTRQVAAANAETNSTWAAGSESFEGGPPSEASAAASQAEPPTVDESVSVDPDGTAVTAPLTGVFYRSPAPGEPPFVEVGMAVEADTVVGIIEVMKMMNTISAGESGVVETIDVDDAKLVEHGQTLIRLKRV